jgi:hypothetical protein
MISSTYVISSICPRISSFRDGRGLRRESLRRRGPPSPLGSYPTPSVGRSLWALWAVIALLLALSDIVFFVRNSRKAARPVLSMLLVKVCLTEVVITAQGLILTLVFIRIGAPEYIPGAWLLAFGTTLTALGLFFPGGLWILGLTVFIASIAASLWPASGNAGGVRWQRDGDEKLR